MIVSIETAKLKATCKYEKNLATGESKYQGERNNNSDLFMTDTKVRVEHV